MKTFQFVIACMIVLCLTIVLGAQIQIGYKRKMNNVYHDGFVQGCTNAQNTAPDGDDEILSRCMETDLSGEGE